MLRRTTDRYPGDVKLQSILECASSMIVPFVCRQPMQSVVLDSVFIFLDAFYIVIYIPLNMPVWTSTRPVLVRCWQHRPCTGLVLAHYGMFMGISMSSTVNSVSLSSESKLTETKFTLCKFSGAFIFKIDQKYNLD